MSKRLTEAVLCLQEAIQGKFFPPSPALYAHMHTSHTCLMYTPGSSLLGVQERLSAMATKLDLKFELQYLKQSELTSIFLMCDAYYVEVCCQDNGYVASVKLAQASNQVRSSHVTAM